MFLKTSASGYDRHGQQFSRGKFLILFAHNEFTWAEQNGRDWSDFPAELKGKLYACVRHTSLHQLGHWMMGCARIADSSITLSGCYGSDGLPCDYEKLSEKARTKLIEVPAELATKFWKSEAHNDAGNEGPAIRGWAKKAFREAL